MKKIITKTTKKKFEALIMNHLIGKYLEILKYGVVTLYYYKGKHFASWQNGKGSYYPKNVGE